MVGKKRSAWPGNFQTSFSDSLPFNPELKAQSTFTGPNRRVSELRNETPLTFLSFSRSMEKEADFLGLEYMYKAGYDPQSFIDFFEKIQTLEKKKPGTMSKVFSTHPPTDDRIKIAQENINRYLKAKPEYVLTTSEFNDVKARLYSLENHRKADDSKDSNRPRLRRNPNAGRGPIDDNSGSDSKPNTDSDERPTLKRRDPD